LALTRTHGARILANVRSLVVRYRFGRFLVVGAFNTLFGYTAFVVLLFSTGNHTLSIVVATAVGVIFNFFTTGRIVFGNRNGWAILPFVLGYAIALLVNVACLDFLVSVGVNAYAAQAACLPVVVAISYLINAYLVFRERGGQARR
jgi:putative flippase GtrA